MQWLRALPADALRKAGNLQKAHQPSLESLLSAQASSGTRICSPEKVWRISIPPFVYASVQRSMCCPLERRCPGLILQHPHTPPHNKLTARDKHPFLGSLFARAEADCGGVCREAAAGRLL